MIKLNLRDETNSLTEEDFEAIGNSSEGFSADDMRALVSAAAMEPFNKCKTAMQFLPCHNPTGGPGFMPCSTYPNCARCRDEKVVRCSGCSAQRITLFDVPREELVVPPVGIEDLLTALQQYNSAVDKKVLKRYEQWTKDHGRDGV